jgi:hypothetical protein
VYGAEALDEVLRHDGGSRALRKYERRMHRNQDLYFRFIHGWYTSGFLELFLSPTEKFQMVPAIVAVLAGAGTIGWRVWLRMQVFFFLVWLQRYAPLAPPVDRSKLPPHPIVKAAAS